MKAVKEAHGFVRIMWATKSTPFADGSGVKALAAHLGKPELVKTCRLVQSVGDSAFSSFKATGV